MSIANLLSIIFVFDCLLFECVYESVSVQLFYYVMNAVCEAVCSNPPKGVLTFFRKKMCDGVFM